MHSIRVDLAHIPEDWPGADVNDLVFIAGSPDGPEAHMVVRPMMLVHQFNVLQILPPAYRLSLSRSLMSFAQGYALQRQFTTHGAIFQVQTSNVNMETFARSLGGKPQGDTTIFRIDRA